MLKFDGLRTRVCTEEKFLRSVLADATMLDATSHGFGYVPKSWVVKRRIIPEHKIYLLTEHGCSGEVRGEPIHLEAGDLFWMMPSVPHAFQIPKGQPRFKLYHLKIQITPAQQKALPRLKQDYFRIQNAQSWHPRMDQLLEEFDERQAFGDLGKKCQLASFFTSVLRAQAEQPGRDLSSGLDARQCRILKTYLDANIKKRPTPATLAATLRMNPQYFARLFRVTYGRAPRVWLVEERMRVIANRLAESNLTISEVAYEFGYHDVYLFSRQFKKVLGKSPRAFRKDLI